MTSPKIERLATLADQFNDAAGQLLETIPNFEQQFTAAVSEQEKREIEMETTRIVFATLKYVDFGDDIPDELAKEIFVIQNKLHALFLRVVSVEQLASCVPADLKNPEDVATLRENGANVLADLCEYNPS